MRVLWTCKATFNSCVSENIHRIVPRQRQHASCIPWQSHYILIQLCRVRPCRASRGRNHQSVEDSAHLHRSPPLLGPICSSEQHAWCHFQTNPGSEFFPPGQPVHSAVVHSVWWGPGLIQQERRENLWWDITGYIRKCVIHPAGSPRWASTLLILVRLS